jgi:hypothetical protein
VKSNLTLYLVSDATLFTTQITRQTCDLHGVGFVGKPLQIGTTCAALTTLSSNDYITALSTNEDISNYPFFRGSQRYGIINSIN